MGEPFHLATRGSPLALAQANQVLELCRRNFSDRSFEIKIVRTTGDKLQTAPATNVYTDLPKGLFTREIEQALQTGEARMAIHSLKDLPTEIPPGLRLGAVLPRADVRDILIYRSATAVSAVSENPTKQTGSWRVLGPGATVATSSTRREAQVRAARPDLRVVPIRGNVGTRLQKLSAPGSRLDGLILAAAGLNRLGFSIHSDGTLSTPAESQGSQSSSAAKQSARVLAVTLSLDEMLPCPGQGAIAIEIREDDAEALAFCQKLNHSDTFASVNAERAFLHAMGGGCQSPIAACAEVSGGFIRLRAAFFEHGQAARVDEKAPVSGAIELAMQLAARLRG